MTTCTHGERERAGANRPLARLSVLHDGYAHAQGVASTVVLVRDGESTIVVDPGMVRSPDPILAPPGNLGLIPVDVADVVLSHHHPDHIWHLALFTTARVHDVWATYEGEQLIFQPAEGREVSPHVTLIETPGHSSQDVTTLVETDEGLVACPHLWWHAGGPAEDPLAADAEALHAGRRRVLDLAPARIVPAFVPDESTPR